MTEEKKINKEEKKEEKKIEETKKEKKQETKKEEKPESKKETKEEKKQEKKETKKEEKPKLKKTEAIVNAYNLPISTKHSKAISKFIKNKKIDDSIHDLEDVLRLKKAIPMKGEIPHRKGMMSGRYPKKAVEHFIILLKSLSSNSIANELEDPIITEVISNLGARPYGRFGRVKKKRTHIKIKAKEKKEHGRKKHS